MFTKSHLILYVKDQALSANFYARVLDQSPTLDVPGMTEFTLLDGLILGLMPESGIMRLLGSALPDPSGAWGIPRSELYLGVDDPLVYYQRALAAGARGLSEPALRDWGDVAAYCLDPDAHVLAFAKHI